MRLDEVKTKDQARDLGDIYLNRMRSLEKVVLNNKETDDRRVKALILSWTLKGRLKMLISAIVSSYVKPKDNE